MLLILACIRTLLKFSDAINILRQKASRTLKLEGDVGENRKDLHINIKVTPRIGKKIDIC